MTYSAWIRFPANVVWDRERTLRVFPRSKRATRFNSVELAERALDRKSRAFAFNTRGEIRDEAGAVVRMVAL